MANNGHAKLSPSSAERWFNCPGSINLIATLPESAFKTTKYAARGTVNHDLAEQFVMGKIDFLTLTTKVGESVMHDGHEVEITAEMVEAVIEYADAIAEIRARMSKPIAIVAKAEVRVHAKTLDEDLWGTTDYLIYQRAHELHVIDFKSGKWRVHAEENEQGLIYLIGAQDTEAGTAYDKIFFHIVQPGHGLTSWEVPKGRLEAFRKELAGYVAATKDQHAKRVAGSWCKFCPALAYCAEAADSVQKAAQTQFTKLPAAPSKEVGMASLPPVSAMTSEQVARALDWEDSIDSWFEAVRARALDELTKDSAAVPGYKLVEGRTNRQWRDETEVKGAFALIGDQLYAPRKILSPTQLEKVVGKKEVEPWVVKPQGKLTVAKVSDKRHAVASPSELAQDIFEPVSAAVPMVKPARKPEPSPFDALPTHNAAAAQERDDEIFGDLMGRPVKPIWP